MATARRAQFLEKSLRLIHHRGFKGTTMTKQEILDETLFDINDEFQKGIDAIISSGYGPLDKLKQITQLYVRLTFEKPYQISLLVNGWRHLTEVRKREFLNERRSYEGKVRQVVVNGIEVGEIRAFDPDICTSMVLSSMRWLFEACVEGQSAMNPIEIERQINDFVNGGLAST